MNRAQGHGPCPSASGAAAAIGRQPHHYPAAPDLATLVSIITPSRRVPVARLINPGFDNRLSAAEAALTRVVEEGWFTLAGIRNHDYRTRLDNPSQLRTYLELIAPPRPRFPPGRRARLLELWASRPRGSKIEIAESIVVTALRRL